MSVNKFAMAGAFGLAAGWTAGVITTTANPYDSYRAKWIVIGSTALLAAAYQRKYIRVDLKQLKSEIPPLEPGTGAAGAVGAFIGFKLP